MSFVIEFHNKEALEWVLKAVEKLLSEASMLVDSKAILLKGMDSSHTGLFSIQINLQKVAASVTCNGGQSVVGFKTKTFLNFISRFGKHRVSLECGVSGNEDVLTMYEPVVEKVGSKRTKNERNECSMKLLDIDYDDTVIPEDLDWIEIEMDAMRWKRILKDVGDISDTIALDCNLTRFKYASEGDVGSSSCHLFPNEDDVHITASDGGEKHVSMQLSLIKVKEGCAKIDVNPGERMKVRIVPHKYTIFFYYLGEAEDSECSLAFYLAGKISDD